MKILSYSAHMLSPLGEICSLTAFILGLLFFFYIHIQTVEMVQVYLQTCVLVLQDRHILGFCVRSLTQSEQQLTLDLTKR